MKHGIRPKADDGRAGCMSMVSQCSMLASIIKSTS